MWKKFLKWNIKIDFSNYFFFVNHIFHFVNNSLRWCSWWCRKNLFWCLNLNNFFERCVWQRQFHRNIIHTFARAALFGRPFYLTLHNMFCETSCNKIVFSSAAPCKFSNRQQKSCLYITSVWHNYFSRCILDNFSRKIYEVSVKWRNHIVL